MLEIEQEPYINAPQLISRRRRMGDAAVTGLMWVLYSYLWAPLVSLLAWLLGFEFAYDVLIRAGGLALLQDVAVAYGLTILYIFVVVSTWSLINRRWSAESDRRKAVVPVSDAEIAAYFEIDDVQLHAMRDSRVMCITLDRQGSIENVEPGALPHRPD